MFPESSPSPFGPDGIPSAMVEEARRCHALELAVQLHSARARGGAAIFVGTVTDTADTFAAYLRGAGDG
jgi:hypothetical protein